MASQKSQSHTPHITVASPDTFPVRPEGVCPGGELSGVSAFLAHKLRLVGIHTFTPDGIKFIPTDLEHDERFAVDADLCRESPSICPREEVAKSPFEVSEHQYTGIQPTNVYNPSAAFVTHQGFLPTDAPLWDSINWDDLCA